jgi:hypothetical protein
LIHARPLIVLGLLAAATPTAVAQPSGAQAEILFRNAQDLMAQGKTAEACAAFDASEKLDPGVTTVLNQANCREKNGQLATAWGLFLEAERQTRAATDDAGKQLHQVAADHAQKLEPRLSTLKIGVPAESRVGGLEIRRDGESVDPGAWNQALPIDGGTYKIAARAPGNAEWTTTLTISAERDARSIDIPTLSPAALALPLVLPPPTTGAALTPGAPERSSEGHTSSPLPLVLGGVAIALAGGAVGFDLWGDSTYDQTKQGTDAQRLAAWRSANAKRYVAEGTGVAALGCAGVAVWLYLRDRHAPADEVVARGIVVTPVVASERAGVALIGRF